MRLLEVISMRLLKLM